MYLITKRQPYGYGRPKIRYSREAWMKVKDPLPMRKGREAQGYSQRDLAALCRCTQAAISALETGTMKSCSEDLARTICHWIKRDLEEVFVDPSPSPVPEVTNAPRSAHRKSRPLAARTRVNTAA
ncbi:MAG: helix-turn-helix transcriptional regulator [Brachybacterium tyrofermentans]